MFANLKTKYLENLDDLRLDYKIGNSHTCDTSEKPNREIYFSK